MTWPLVKIGDVCKTGAGGTPLKSKKEYYKNGTIPWLLSGEVSQGNIFSSKKFITEDGLKNSSARMFPKDTVLVAMYGATAGQVGILRFEAATNQAVCGICPNESFLPEYLYYAMLFKQAELISKAAGNAQPNISQIKIKDTEIPSPTVKEQKLIVAILDEAFAGIDTAIANTEKNLANARELFESYLNSVFTRRGEGWVEKQLGDICSITSKLVDPRDDKFIDLKHVGAGNIVSFTGDLIQVQTARNEKLISGKFVFDEQMVLYSKIRPYLMKVVRPDFVGLCSADIYPLKPFTDLLDRDFLYYLLLSKKFTKYAIAGSERAGMPKVNREHLFQFSVALPEVTEQKRIVEQLDATVIESRRIEIIYKQKLNSLKELKQSLLQKAFSGELATARAAPNTTHKEEKVA